MKLKFKNLITNLWVKLNAIMLFLFYGIPIYYLPVNAVSKKFTSGDGVWTAFQNFYKEYNVEMTLVQSFAMLFSVGIFIYHCVALGNHATNPQARKQDINNLLITGFCLAGQGSLFIILGVLYNTFM